jgi:hypothetical protein
MQEEMAAAVAVMVAVMAVAGKSASQLQLHQPSYKMQQLRALLATVLTAAMLVGTSDLNSASPEEDHVALFAAATAAYLECQAPQSLAPSDTICLFGNTNDAMKAAFKGGLKPTTKFVVIESPGGPVTPAMDIALAMMERGIDVIVKHKCLSSCANYIFLAAPHKILVNKAVVGWHGSPASYPKEKLTTLSEQARARVAQQLDRHNQFFAILKEQGIREELVNVPPPTFKPGYSIWTYHEKILEEKFGVRNVIRLNIDSEMDK